MSTLQTTAVGTIALVFLILAFSTILSTRLKISPVLLEILIGIVIGPNMLGLIDITVELDFLKDLGLIILLFLAGLDFEFQNFRRKIKDALLIAIPPGIVGFGLIFILIPFQWFHSVELLTLALILTTTSISLSVSVLKEKMSTQETDNYDTVVLAIIISNVMMILVAGIMVGSITGKDVNYWSVFSQFLIVLFFIILVLFASQNLKFVWHKQLEISEEGMEYAQTKFAFGLLGLILFISYLLNVEMAVASFFAGVYVKETTDLQRQNLTKFNIIGYGFLIPVFFVVMGMQINPSHFLVGSVLQQLSLILVLSFVFQVSLTAISSYLANFSIKESIYIGIGLSACSLSGGFAVLEIANRSSIITEEAYSIFSAIITLSVLMTVIGLEVFDKINRPKIGNYQTLSSSSS